MEEQEVVENVEETEEIIDETIVEGDEETEGSTEDEEQETEEEESELEDWMKEDSDEENDEKPVKFLKAKKRLKGELAQKDGELAQKDEELERIKAELEALKNNRPAPPTGLKRPDELDYETTEEYHTALDAYNVKLFETEQQKKTQAEAVEKVKQEIQLAADAHYDRAEKLMEESGIAPEKYKSADMKFRQAVANALPENADTVADFMLGKLGEGSEKVGYYIGNNEAARLKFQSLLVEDPTGITAGMYLGEQKRRLNTNPRKQTSKAKAPAKNVSGDAKIGTNEAAMKKKFQEINKKPNKHQEAFNLWKAAKKAGMDVSKWD